MRSIEPEAALAQALEDCAVMQAQGFKWDTCIDGASCSLLCQLIAVSRHALVRGDAHYNWSQLVMQEKEAMVATLV